MAKLNWVCPVCKYHELEHTVMYHACLDKLRCPNCEAFVIADNEMEAYKKLSEIAPSIRIANALDELYDYVSNKE